jgi:hypothetical protein
MNLTMPGRRTFPRQSSDQPSAAVQSLYVMPVA